jgi:hypothetical protein
MTDHICTSETCPEPGAYFVSVRNDLQQAPDWRALLGPFPSHAIALAWVPRGQRLAEELDSKAVWYSFGTVRMEDSHGRPGLLNPLVEEELMATTFAEDDLVQATAPGVSVQPGDKGRVIEDGTHEYHRVYWPTYGIVAYHLGTQLKLLGRLGG